MSVEILPHTADLQLRITAGSLADLFREALRGMTEASEPVWAGRQEVRRDFNIQSPDRNALLVDFLSEAIRSGDTNNESYTGIILDDLTETSLRGRLIGRAVERLALEIKAVTYHGLDIKHSDGRWSTTIVFDI